MIKKYLVLMALFIASRGVAANRPNVVLMMADDLGWGDVEFNGGTTIKTPALQAMAENGMVFERFYAAAPVCSPTRGSMLTGRHPYRLGIPFANSGHLKSAEYNLAEMLKAKGYRTGHFGKWHLGTLTKTVKESNRGGPKGAAHYAPPWEHGFEVCFSTEAKTPTWDPMWKPKEGASSRGWNALEAPAKDGVPYGTHYWNEQGEQISDNLLGDDSRVIVDRVEPFLRDSVKAGKPFFAVVWFHTPHLPVVAGPRYFNMYPDAPSDFHRNYYGCITAMDEQVGRIRTVLKELGIAEHTLISFCSDNGPEGKSDSPGSAGLFSGRKRSLLEGGVRVPGVIEWPEKIKPGSRTTFAAVTSDLLPTVAEIVDADVRVHPVDGVSLLPVFAGTLKERETPLGFQSQRQAAWHEGVFKIYRNGKSSWALYHLEDDPSESNNLAKTSPNKVKAMAERFEAWQASCRRSESGKDY